MFKKDTICYSFCDDLLFGMQIKNFKCMSEKIRRPVGSMFKSRMTHVTMETAYCLRHTLQFATRKSDWSERKGKRSNACVARGKSNRNESITCVARGFAWLLTVLEILRNAITRESHHFEILSATVHEQWILRKNI